MYVYMHIHREAYLLLHHHCAIDYYCNSSWLDDNMLHQIVSWLYIHVHIYVYVYVLRSICMEQYADICPDDINDDIDDGCYDNACDDGDDSSYHSNHYYKCYCCCCHHC